MYFNTPRRIKGLRDTFYNNETSNLSNPLCFNNTVSCYQTMCENAVVYTERVFGILFTITKQVTISDPKP